MNRSYISFGIVCCIKAFALLIEENHTLPNKLTVEPAPTDQHFVNTLENLKLSELNELLELFRRHYRLSRNAADTHQMARCYRNGLDIKTELEQRAKRKSQTGQYLPLIEFMDRAHEAGLKSPKIRLEDDQGRKVTLVRNQRGKYPGAITVRENGYNSLWYGTVRRGGTVYKTGTRDEHVWPMVDELNKDPQSSAKAHGQRTSNCCFCATKLTNPASVTAGYGPICAEKYGLPWGEVAEGLSEHCEIPNRYTGIAP